MKRKRSLPHPPNSEPLDAQIAKRVTKLTNKVIKVKAVAELVTTYLSNLDFPIVFPGDGSPVKLLRVQGADDAGEPKLFDRPIESTYLLKKSFHLVLKPFSGKPIHISQKSNKPPSKDGRFGLELDNLRVNVPWRDPNHNENKRNERPDKVGPELIIWLDGRPLVGETASALPSVGVFASIGVESVKPIAKPKIRKPVRALRKSKTEPMDWTRALSKVSRIPVDSDNDDDEVL